MALKKILGVEKDKQVVELLYEQRLNKKVYQVKDTRNDNLNNVYYISPQKAFDVYDEKSEELKK